MLPVDRTRSPVERLPAALLLSTGTLVLSATAPTAQERSDSVTQSHAVALGELADRKSTRLNSSHT